VAKGTPEDERGSRCMLLPFQKYSLPQDHPQLYLETPLPVFQISSNILVVDIKLKEP
jgi:hypothetical protein